MADTPVVPAPAAAAAPPQPPPPPRRAGAPAAALLACLMDVHTASSELLVIVRRGAIGVPAHQLARDVTACSAFVRLSGSLCTDYESTGGGSGALQTASDAEQVLIDTQMSFDVLNDPFTGALYRMYYAIVAGGNATVDDDDDDDDDDGGGGGGSGGAACRTPENLCVLARSSASEALRIARSVGVPYS